MLKTTSSDKDINKLHRLKRVELLKILVSLSEENDTLRAEVDRLSKLLDDRNIQMKNVGSIAEAAVNVNGVFEAAQAAADQYLESIARMDDEAKKRSEAMLAKAQGECDDLKARTHLEVETEKAILEKWVDRYDQAEQRLGARLASIDGAGQGDQIR